LDITLDVTDPAEDLDMEKLSFTWEVILIQPKQMEIQLIFSNPAYISMNPLPDWISVRFLDPLLFRYKYGYELEPSSAKISSEIGK